MTIPAVRRSSRLLSASKAVYATESLTRLIACSVADEILERLTIAVDRDRADSEIALLNAFAEHDDVTMEVSPALSAILLQAQEAARLSGGLVDPVVGIAGDSGAHIATEGSGVPYSFDPDRHVLYMRRGTVLDLWNIGCAWAAEEIVARVVMQDPAASFAVVVGPAVVSVGAAWEISDALEQDFAMLQAPLRCGLRSFAILHQHLPNNTAHADGEGRRSASSADVASAPHECSSGDAPEAAWWDRASVGAEDAVQAITLALMAQRLGESAFDHIVQAGGQAEFVGPRGRTPLRRRMRTPGWVPSTS